jgi:transposase, IS30 family|tara:strand:- start:24 stop:230 length:207 start_codon:yes stop_codon:yes gene_type:complete
MCGLNENTNGLVRKYLPKGTDFSKLTAAGLPLVEDLLNNRTRKADNYHSPKEVLVKPTAKSKNYVLGM